MKQQILEQAIDDLLKTLKIIQDKEISDRFDSFYSMQEIQTLVSTTRYNVLSSLGRQKEITEKDRLL